MADTETAVQYALAQVGKPYVWGTAGPNTFDCSGLLYAAYRHAGFRISRTTYTQIGDGTPVAANQMRRGDLWFTDPGHVAIYLGDGRFVEAPNAQSKVRVVPVRTFFAGRRLGTPSSVPPSQSGGTPIGIVPDLSGLKEAVGVLTTPHTWLRILTILVGLILAGLILRGLVMSQARKVTG
jgi:hypothetical protein